MALLSSKKREFQGTPHPESAIADESQAINLDLLAEEMDAYQISSSDFESEHPQSPRGTMTDFSNISVSKLNLFGTMGNVAFDTVSLKIESEEDLKQQSKVVRVWHSDSAIPAAIARLSMESPKANVSPRGDSEKLHAISQFKTVMINGLTTAREVCTMMKLKLLLGDDAEDYHLSIDVDNEKHALSDTDRVATALNRHQKAGSELRLLYLKSSTEYYVSIIGSSIIRKNQFSQGGRFYKKDEFKPSESQKPLKHRFLLNDQNYAQFSNLTFVIEGTRIYSFRNIVQQRCPQLLTSSAISKSKERKSSIGPVMTLIVTEGSFLTKFALTQVLDYLYSGQIETSELTIPEIELVLFSAQKIGIPRLEWICDQALRSHLSISNLYIMLRQAHELEINTVKNFCVTYALANWAEFTTDRTGLSIIGIDLFQELTILNSQKNASEIESSGRVKRGTVVGPKNTLIEDFNAILRNSTFNDGKALFGDEEVNFSRAIVAAHSPALKQLMESGKDGKPIRFNKIDKYAFQSMLEFIYCGSCENMTARSACDLIQNIVYTYDMPELRDYCEIIMGTEFSVEDILRIFYTTYLPICENRSICQKIRINALDFICQNFSRINTHELRQYKQPLMAYDLLDLLNSMERSVVSSGVPAPTPSSLPSSSSPSPAVKSSLSSPSSLIASSVIHSSPQPTVKKSSSVSKKRSERRASVASAEEAGKENKTEKKEKKESKISLKDLKSMDNTRIDSSKADSPESKTEKKKKKTKEEKPGESRIEEPSPKAEEAKAEESKVEEAKVEEAKVEEAKAEEPKVEAKADEPNAKAEESKAKEPKVEEAKAEEPKVEEAKVEEPKVEEPKAEEPKVEEPKAEEPKVEAKVEEAEVEEPKVEPEAKAEEAKADEPKVEAETEEPKVEAETEEPKSEEPKSEEPKATTKELKVEKQDQTNE